MSKYSRARTPPSPPPLSKKSSPSRHSSKNYDIHSKSYREYDKYDDQPDNYKKAKYDKSDKRDRYDKFEKSDFKSSYSTASREYNNSSYASNLSKKSSRSDKRGEKNESSYREVSIPYKSKTNLYPEDRYSDRDPYISKYVSSEAERYSKYASPSKDISSSSKYSSKPVNADFTSASSNRRYSPYLLNKSSSSTSYTKLEADPYYADGGQSYSTYRGIKNISGRSVVEGGPDRVSQRSDSTKSYANQDLSSNSHNYYERYVIGDSVVYGSPGHYPRDIYSPSPKSKSRRSPPSPPPLPSLSKTSTYGKHASRYSPPSPKRFRSKSLERGSSPYSSRLKSPMRRPPSPPPLLSSFRNLSPIRYSRNAKQRRNCTPPLSSERDKGNRYDDRKRSDMKDNDRRNRLKDFNSFRDKGSSYSSYENGPLRGSGKDVPLRPSRPIGSPKPLLSIPLTLNNVPRESRANVRETLCLGEPRGRKGEKGGPPKMRRFEGRIGLMSHGLNNQGRTQLNRNRAISPGERKKRRPDDLRLWIESRKTVGRKKATSPVAKSSRGTLQKRLPRGGAIPSTNRRRLNDSTRRILNKGKRRIPALPLRKGLKVRRAPLKPHDSEVHSSRRSRDKTTKREERAPKNAGESRKVDSIKKNIRKEGKTNGNRSRSKDRNVTGSSANTHRVIKRPRVVSNANSLPVKPRPVKKTVRKSPGRDRSVAKSGKFHPRSNSRGKSLSPRKGERSPRREKSPRRNERSPRRDEK